MTAQVQDGLGVYCHVAKSIAIPLWRRKSMIDRATNGARISRSSLASFRVRFETGCFSQW